MKTKDEILKVLDAIERKEIAIESPDCEPAEQFCGDIRYVVPSLGWEIYVFDDCNEWDYIDHIVFEDGEIIDPWDDDRYNGNDWEWIRDYSPVDSSMYGI